MAEDKEVLREIWEGKIPVTFTLEPSNVVTSQRPTPFYLMVPRVSYFPLVMDKMVANFSPFVDDSVKNGKDLWLEFEGSPLKWHYPIGLLWDFHGFDSPGLPFSITVHFTGFPDGELVRLNTKPAIDNHFLATIKEADVIKRRNNNVMSNFQTRDRSQLTTGLYNQKFDQFWSVNRKLMDTTREPFKNIPIRIYTQDRSVPLQRLIKPATEDGEPTTLFDVLDIVHGDKLDSDPSDIHVVIHGIEPPLETHLQWLSEHFSYPDNFLHVCVHKQVND